LNSINFLNFKLIKRFPNNVVLMKNNNVLVVDVSRNTMRAETLSRYCPKFDFIFSQFPNRKNWLKQRRCIFVYRLRDECGFVYTFFHIMLLLNEINKPKYQIPMLPYFLHLRNIQIWQQCSFSRRKDFSLS
jgi:hypothetical protein